MWSRVYNWPLIPIHAVLMPDGRVLTYGSDGAGHQTGKFIYDVWDGGSNPEGGHLTLPNITRTDIFCSSNVLLPLAGSQVFIAGGDNWTGTQTTNTGNADTNVFNGSDNSLAPGNGMNRPRWYATSTVLLNGEIYLQGGKNGGDRAEVRKLDGSFDLLPFDTSTLVAEYPRNFIAPDGRLFGIDAAGVMYYVDVAGRTLTKGAQLPAAYRGVDSTTAMFRPGRILQFGGASNAAVVVDVTGVSPVATPTGSLSSQRRRVSSTLLPDGTVLATGGSTVDQSLTGVNYNAEIWDPQTGVWTLGAAGVKARLYHSTALLLPDATVLVGGGGAPGPQNNRNVEIYYPPYLFTADGREAARPSILGSPNTIEIGKVFELQVDDPAQVGRVVLLKSGAVTHSVNMDQRFIELSFGLEDGKLKVQAPTRAGEAPPGTYMVFVLDTNGVPSKAVFTLLGVAANPDPGVIPRLTAPGDRSTVLGQSVNLALQATDPNADTLRFAATGLPDGLSIDVTTGRITGTVTAVGNFNVVVSVSDGVNAVSQSLVWSVTSEVPLGFDSLVAAPPASVEGTVHFSATASGTGVQYQWNFGDGSPPSNWSASGQADHAYARAGAYFASVTIRDSNGAQQVRTVLQTVYLPATANRPTASTNITSDVSPSGVTRIWVVNQDNDSVSLLDAATGAKLGEIAVGSAPRSIAAARNGRMWVANKGSNSVSVIDPQSLTVVQTLAMPRGSQPYGIAMSPVANTAFIVLEGSGQVLRYSTDSGTQTGSLGVGLHVRHAAVSADGSKLLVSRFITPPLPGEATAKVTPNANTGGEVLLIATGTMTLTKKIVLRHSDAPDTEFSGRGIPNYLGAAVISPDGTQAWVPSKQDNVQRGGLRDGLALDFQNTVRAVSSRIDMATTQEDASSRIDHDNASVASAALYDPLGVYLFVALETSRQVAVVDAHAHNELFRFDTGLAPQGLALSPDGNTLFVNNAMSRTVGVFDLLPLRANGEMRVAPVASLGTVGVEKLAVSVLRGKQLFYDAKDTRLARDGYMSCAACHNEGTHDGRVWDLSSLGEGLRNTTSLRGKGGGQGFRHWSANFDETQDFEGQIRALAGGTGLMSDASYYAGTRSSPLGDKKSGASADLDALAAYVASLGSTPVSPFRTSSGGLSTDGSKGQTVFQTKACASCHAGSAFTGSGNFTPVNVGTIKPTSGNRLGGPLLAIDVPTLRDVWATAPYLHDGSAATLQDAVRAHTNIAITSADLDLVAAFLREQGSELSSAPIYAGSGTGLTGTYYANTSLSGTPVLTRTEVPNFSWGTGAPTGVPTDNFSARWTGTIKMGWTGTYRFQTRADDGIRLWIDDVLVLDRWKTASSAVSDSSVTYNFTAGQSVSVRLEYYSTTGNAQVRLLWWLPGNGDWTDVAKDRLYP